MIKVINTINESYSPKLSCFWIINNELYGDEVKLKDAAAQGDYLVDNTLHYFLWDSIKQLNTNFSNKAYDYYPRGRVRFNIKIQQPEVIADIKIINNEKIKELIKNELGLPPTTVFNIDEYYKSMVDIDCI